MALYRIAKPATLAVSLEDIKKHLRGFEDGRTDEDDRVQAHLDAAINHVDGEDGWLGRALIDQTWELRLDNFGCRRCIEIPLPPLIEVISVQYFDADNAEQTVDEDDYRVIGLASRAPKPSRIELVQAASWPTVYSRSEAVTIRFRAGYLDTSESPAVADVPPKIASAIKLRTQFSFEGSLDAKLVQSADELLLPFIIYSR